VDRVLLKSVLRNLRASQGGPGFGSCSVCGKECHLPARCAACTYYHCPDCTAPRRIIPEGVKDFWVCIECIEED
jgi:hypothetical protein